MFVFFSSRRLLTRFALVTGVQTWALPISMMGKGSVSDLHPLTIGVVGAAMGVNSPTRYQRELITSADLVVLVGNRTNQNGTDSYSLYPTGAQYIHIDIDSQEIGRNYEAKIGRASCRERVCQYV